MTCAIVSVPHAQRAFVARMLGGAVYDTTSGGGRTYAMTFVKGRRGDDVSYADLDGSMLVECRFFDTEAAARAWVAHGIAQAKTVLQ